MITIKLEHVELIPTRYYSGTVNFNQPSLTKICGDNGVGKSTFFHYCQLHEKNIFPSPVCFLEQKALLALHNYSLHEVKKLLESYWSTFFIPHWRDLWENMCATFNLHADYKIQQLSGGQNQLLKLMLCSILDRKIYFWDEPFTALDPKMVAWWMNWIEQQIKNNTTLIIIDHSTRLDKIATSNYYLAFKDLDNVEFNKIGN